MRSGVVLGILPVTLEVLFGPLAPALVLPGSDFDHLTIVLIPAALITAILRRQRSGRLAVCEA